MVSYVTLDNSSFLDLTSGNTNGTAPTGDAFGGSVTFNVALVMERANDPTELLNADWGTRQKTLAALNDSGTLWSTYGADPEAFQSVVTELGNLGITVLNPGGDVNAQYVTSAESRTIWVQLDESSFTTLFGPDAALRLGTDGDDEFLFWAGDLSLPEPIAAAGVKGLWFDTGDLGHTVTADPGTGTEATLTDGPQGPGNSGGNALYPNEIAALYDFPFADPTLWQAVQTGAIGLVEPGVGSSLPGSATATFDELLAAYRAEAGITVPLPTTITVAGGGQEYDGSASERSLDVGIVTAVNPNAQLVIYAGSGSANHAGSDAFTAYQSAIWDTVNNIAVLSSSDKSYPNVAADSPFQFALDELFVDAALRNITVVNSIGDGGSGNQYGNGLTNVSAMHATPFAIAVGGTSISTFDTGGADETLSSFYMKALKGNRATIWDLVKGGMTTSPSDAAATQKFIETVWNQYGVYASDTYKGVIGNTVNDEGGYLVNLTTAGGVDLRQPTPGYQRDYGLDPTTADPRAAPGRGVPDVAALAGGNMKYTVPKPDLETTHGNGGTSAASPLWASLMLQMNAIFADQNLPRPGYMNDLLYIASVIAPASFNDITVGSNTSSFVYGGDYLIGGTDTTVTPTGYGYAAGDGYDYVSGLGTPNGVLLARALSAIAHSELTYGDSAAMVEKTGSAGFSSKVKQGLLVQVTASEAVTVKVKASDGIKVKLTAEAADKFAWDSRLAQQVLQPEFDKKLVKMFDGQSQSAASVKVGIKADADLRVKVDKLEADAPQGTMSADYGFIDYAADGTTVRIARPVAVAETVGGADDQVAVVRFRQATKEKVVFKFYKVDDFKGKIDGLKPGEKGYNAAANERAYEMSNGKSKIKGPGYGKYNEKQLAGFDSGDIVAMKIKSGGHTYFGFAQGNEKAHGDHVGHLWNYGLNTWGWEADYKGGDRDFNDLIVQIDFTSAYGHGWLL